MKKEKDNFDYKPYIKDMIKYFNNNFLSLKPYPKIRIVCSPEDGVFIKTGYYDFANKEIVLMVGGRHVKDVLRSLAHELIHHNQNIENRIDHKMIDGTSLMGEDEKTKYLENLESEAFLKGNIFFRKWTEVAKNKKF